MSLVGCFPRPGGVLVSVVGRPVCKPLRAGGTGARVQGRSRRPQEGPGLCKANVGAAWAVARRVRCTSGRNASAACGVRGVRAAQQRGSRQSDSSKQAKRLEQHDVVEEVA